MDQDLTLRGRLEAAGQTALCARLDAGDEAAKALSQALGSVDLALVGRLKQLLEEGPPASASGFAPPQTFPLVRGPELQETIAQAARTGEELLRAGKVAALVVAGGQGSRLGYAGPKGNYPCGPVSGKSLFAWHAARIQAARQRYGCRLPWLVMTSQANDQETRESFARESYFGLGADTVHFFTQAMLPALDQGGQMILSSPSEFFLAPNGHGGTLEALARSGLLQALQAQGVEQLSYFQVDNPLARPADPLFLGLHAARSAEMSSKVVSKRDAGEKVGVLGLADGVLGCIEYSDLPASLREERTDSGQLLFSAGNIAVHAIRLDFIAQLTAGGDLDLPWHLAKKKIQGLTPSGTLEPMDGVKFETFVFDALGRTTESVVMEVDRAVEFSPIKNAEGEDSPATCRETMTRTFGQWVEAAGLGDPPKGPSGEPLVEVDPTVAETLEEFLASGVAPVVTENGWLFRHA